MNVLFVCHANLNRSPRAAEVFRKLADQRGLDVEVQSAGTNAWARDWDPEALRREYGVSSTTQLTRDMLKKTDIVVALDNFVEEEIRLCYKVTPKNMIILDVEDRYTLKYRNLDALYEILNQKLEPLVEKISLLERKHRGKESV